MHDEPVTEIDVEARFLGGVCGEQIYAVRSAPGDCSRRRDCVAVVCPPLLEEHRWSYRVLYRLAASLAEAGFVTWRFDFSGTGNSGGALCELDRWRAEAQEIVAQIVPLEKESARLGMIGLRLGAFIGFHACAADRRFATAVLLSPILDPWRHIRQLLHSRVLTNRVVQAADDESTPDRQAAVEKRSESTELFGYRLDKEFVDSFRKARSAVVAPHNDLKTLVFDLERPARATKAAQDHWIREHSTRGLCMEHKAVEGAPFWGRIGMFDAPELREGVLEWFSELFPWRKP